MSEVNCLTHEAPHARGGRCSVWVAATEEAYRQAAPDLSGWYRFLPDDFRDCRWAPDRWQEPHVGISGAVRDDDLLDLTDEALARRRIMIVMAKALHDALLVGNPAPRVKRLYDRFGRDKARPGDLVIEATALYGDHEARGFGILVDHREEWACTLAEWQQVIEEEREAWNGDYGPFDPESDDLIRQTDHAWYVQYGPKPGDLCRWTNCSFVGVPMTDEQLADEPVGTRDGSGVVLTRNDLVGALADAGFGIASRSGE